MVTHWESSRRPLYVKTVWKDGQHHVILDKTKEGPLETSQSRKTKCCSNHYSHRSKSAITGTNFRVSSVRAIFSGVNSFKAAQKSVRLQEHFTDRTSTRIKPSVMSRPITSKILNKEVTFHAIQGTKAPKLCKSNAVALECITVEKPSEPTLNYVPNNALSEKVMIWLDLAVQNGHMDREVKQNTAVTAQACQLIKKTRKRSEVNGDENNAQEVISSSILKNATPRQDSEKEDIIVYSNEEVEDLEDDFYHVLSPSMDKHRNGEKSLEEDDRKGVNTAKRQLHIFMPNLPKRSSDCDSSILSSKVSVN